MKQLLSLSLVYMEHVHLAIFLADSTAEGCAIELRNDQRVLEFNISRHNNEYLELECFHRPDAGIYNVYTYEIQLGELQNHTCVKLPNITLQKTKCEKN